MRSSKYGRAFSKLGKWCWDLNEIITDEYSDLEVILSLDSNMEILCMRRPKARGVPHPHAYTKTYLIRYLGEVLY